jgi:phosphoglycerol transferase MdoB-like AlkP superfamily enzyme
MRSANQDLNAKHPPQPDRSSNALNFFLNLCLQMLILNLVYLLVMSGFRAFSYLYYGNLNELSAFQSELMRAYWLGLRFDLSALCYIAVIPFLVSGILAIPLFRISQFKVTHFVKMYYLVFWPALLICLICDTGYYSYFQDHLNILLFGLFEDDTVALLKTVWKNYPILKISFVFLIIVYLFYRLQNKIFSQQLISNFFFRPAWVVLAVLGISLGARGSLGLFPLSLQDTVVSSHAFVNHLSYNGFHALIRAIKLRNKQNHNWDLHYKYYDFSDHRQPFADYFDLTLEQVPSDPLTLIHKKTPTNEWAEKTQPHVIVLMMESFGSAYFQFHNPEFPILGSFAKHLEEDFYTLHFLPSHSSTIGSLSSFMVASPQRPQSGFLTESDLMQVPFRSSAATVYEQKNYQTRFLYGGNPGWRDINKFARYQGFQEIEGEVDIEKKLGPLKEKHDWGVYDEDVFEFLYQTLLDSTKPQFVLTMTTTNHPPYQIPSTYQLPPMQKPETLVSRLIADRFLVEKRFQAYQYSNQKLGEFLTRIKNSPLADKVIIAVTGDHSFWMVQFSDDEIFHKWGVPFYLYTPKTIRPKPSKNIYASHMDILPTLYHLSLSDAAYHGIGTNIFDPNRLNAAFFTGEIAVADFGGIRSKKGKNYLSFQWQNQALVPTDNTNQHELLAKKYKALMALTDLYFHYEKKEVIKK